MAGLGSRFTKAGVLLPKPLIRVNGLTLLEHSIQSFNIREARFIFVTRDYGNSHNNEIEKIINQYRPDSTIIPLENVTAGAAETVLSASDFIDSNELVVYNCDQRITWNPEEFLKWRNSIEEIDGAVVCHKSSDPKNSFAKLGKDGLVEELREKIVISDHALIGFHWWKSGLDFLESATNLMQNFRRTGAPECYISETYNWLIKRNKKIYVYHIPTHNYIPLGTPEDIARYIGKNNEFGKNKPKTIFLDIDGTILLHMHTISDVYLKEPQMCPGVREKLNSWDSVGHKIILTTARKESTRKHTEKQLEQLGIAYDQLVMGLTTGTRIIINDKLTDGDDDRALSVNVITDSGFSSINWEDFSL